MPVSTVASRIPLLGQPLGAASRAAEANLRESSNLGDHNRALRERKDEITSSFNNRFNRAKSPFHDPKRDNYQTYPYDYFCGADAKVFFGDIWVDDIVTIQWNVSQTKTPVYGYASQYYDAVAMGTVIVQGALVVSFKEVGYLNVIQSLIESQNRRSNEAVSHYIGTQRALSENRLAKFTPGLTAGDPREFTGYSFSANGTPQIIRQQDTIESILLKKKGNLVASGLSRDLFLNDSERDFEDFAELLEDTIWGDSNGRPYGSERRIKRADEFDYTYRSGSNPTGIKTPLGHNYADALNILVTFGDINDFRAEHTMVALNDVHFQSQGMIVAQTGEPIAETYNFFCKDINRSLGTTTFNIDPIKLNVGVDVDIAKLEQIKAVEDFIRDSEANQESEAVIVAALGEAGWRSEGGIVNFTFTRNQVLPFIDQVIDSVETAFNAPENDSTVDTNMTQYVVHVVIGSAPEVTVVLSQSIPNTRTYKVISPTRQSFGSNNVITRDILFKDVGALPYPEDTVKSRLDADRAKFENAIAQAENEQAKASNEIFDEIGTDKINQKINKQTNKVGEINESISESEERIAGLISQGENTELSVKELNKLNRQVEREQRRLERLKEKATKEATELDELKFERYSIQTTPLDQRDLGRKERSELINKQADLSDLEIREFQQRIELEINEQIRGDYQKQNPNINDPNFTPDHPLKFQADITASRSFKANTDADDYYAKTAEWEEYRRNAILRGEKDPGEVPLSEFNDTSFVGPPVPDDIDERQKIQNSLEELDITGIKPGVGQPAPAPYCESPCHPGEQNRKVSQTEFPAALGLEEDTTAMLAASQQKENQQIAARSVQSTAPQGSITQNVLIEQQKQNSQSNYVPKWDSYAQQAAVPDDSTTTFQDFNGVEYAVQDPARGTQQKFIGVGLDPDGHIRYNAARGDTRRVEIYSQEGGFDVNFYEQQTTGSRPQVSPFAPVAGNVTANGNVARLETNFLYGNQAAPNEQVTIAFAHSENIRTGPVQPGDTLADLQSQDPNSPGFTGPHAHVWFELRNTSTNEVRRATPQEAEQLFQGTFANQYKTYAAPRVTQNL